MRSDKKKLKMKLQKLSSLMKNDESSMKVRDFVINEVRWIAKNNLVILHETPSFSILGCPDRCEM